MGLFGLGGGGSSKKSTTNTEMTDNRSVATDNGSIIKATNYNQFDKIAAGVVTNALNNSLSFSKTALNDNLSLSKTALNNNLAIATRAIDASKSSNNLVVSAIQDTSSKNIAAIQDLVTKYGDTAAGISGITRILPYALAAAGLMLAYTIWGKK